MVDKVFLVVGAGSIGNRHAGNLRALGEIVELIPYRDFDAGVIAQRDDVAGMVIATATPVRLDLIRLCAAQDWPFYAEKPLAWTPAQVAEIYDSAAPVADRSMVGFMMRYHPGLLALAQSDLSGIYGFTFEIGHDVRQWRANWLFPDSYASAPAGGGVLLDLCHEVDIAHCLFPQIKVTAVSSLNHTDFPTVDFATRISLSAPGGPTGTVAMDYLSPVNMRNGALRGTKVKIDIDLLSSTIRENDGRTDKTQTFTFERNDMFLQIMADFVALAKGKSTSDNPLMPRFDRVRDSCDLIARAWEAREFTGQVAVCFD
jgi:predicted dehydrogenase